MRDHAIGVIEYLEQRLGKEIISGEAILSVHDPSLPPERFNEHESPRDRILRAPFPERYQPTVAQRKEMLIQALGELEERKRIWREGYRELYAAANKAFPLKRLFAVEAQR